MEQPMKRGTRGLNGRVGLKQQPGHVKEAEVELLRLEKKKGVSDYQEHFIAKTQTNERGRFHFDQELQDGQMYRVRVKAFGPYGDSRDLDGPPSGDVRLEVNLGLEVTKMGQSEEDRLLPAPRGVVGKRMLFKLESPASEFIGAMRWGRPAGASVVEVGDREVELMASQSGSLRLDVRVSDRDQNTLGGRAEASTFQDIGVSDQDVQMMGGQMSVTMRRTASDPTLDQSLWVAIRNRSCAVSFTRYREFLNRVLQWDENERFPDALERRMKDLGANLHGVGAYQMLKVATEIFLLMECGVKIRPCVSERFPLDELDERSRLNEDVTPEQMQARLHEYLGTPPQLPYITRVVQASFPEYGEVWPHRDRVLTARINEPCLLELIWCYWHEEGMLMQSINAIANRFQNVRRPGGRDPLSAIEIDPLRPLNNLLWGFVQDEIHRLSVKRRAYEYMHQYGLSLFGRATGVLRPADNRSKFLEGFHNLLFQASKFFKEDFQTTVIADGFPLLNALKEVHMALAEGAHNQFGDLTWTARVEMMLSQYMLGRPEIREFLQSRIMVPYKEPWMPQVDTLKTVEGWTDVSVSHFSDLAIFGEQLLLSIRYGDWINVNNENSAKNWARYWRPEIQGYLHSYRVATGIDLTNAETIDSTLPSVHLQRRLAGQRARMRLELR